MSSIIVLLYDPEGAYMLKNLAKLGLTALAVATISSGALAQSQTINFGPFTSTAVHSFNYAKFNPSLGTLTEVTETLVLDGTLTARVIDPNGGGDAYSNFQIGSSATGTVVSTALTTTANVTSGVYTGVTTTVINTAGVASVSNTTTTHLFTGLGTFIGPGTAVDGLSVALGSVNTLSGNDLDSASLGFGGVQSLGGSVTIVYDYTPTSHTPEPGSVALLFAGSSVAFAGLRRRRSLKK